MDAALPRLMLVTDRHRTRGRDLVDLVARAAEGGVRLVQLRERDLSDDALREIVVRLRERVPPDTLLVVNGSLRVARTMGIGLHLPAAAPAAGRIAGEGRLYGRSAHDETEVRRALDDGAGYLVVGSVFATASKPGRRPVGIAVVECACRLAHPVPVFGIGGIGVARIPALLHAGAHGVAVCGAILEDNDPRRVAQAMHLALEVSVGAIGARARAPRGAG